MAGGAPPGAGARASVAPGHRVGFKDGGPGALGGGIWILFLGTKALSRVSQPSPSRGPTTGWWEVDQVLAVPWRQVAGGMCHQPFPEKVDSAQRGGRSGKAWLLTFHPSVFACPCQRLPNLSPPSAPGNQAAAAIRPGALLVNG